MIEMCLTRKELVKALEQLDIAYKNGFKNSLAIVRLVKAGDNIDEFLAKYDSLILKAHPTDPNKDWGRTNNPHWYAYRNGKCVDKEDLVA
jgi:hypothetical protein